MSISSFGLTRATSATTASRDACRTAVTGLIPLPELGADFYQGAQGGLYPGGANIMPDPHLSAGLRLADELMPRDASGEVSERGRIGLVSIGVSNTLTEFETFIQLFADDPRIADEVEFVNAAQNGEDADHWLEADGDTWTYLTQAVEQAGLTLSQIQAAWVKLPDHLPDHGQTKDEISFPATILRYSEKLTVAIANARLLMPNLRLVYMSSRIYGGYASGPQSEPLSYEQGFGVKWVIEDQINGQIPVISASDDSSQALPWLAWGPYLWADGTTARADGLTWLCPDFDSDHVHPSAQGAEKVAGLLFDFLRGGPTSSPWFNASGVPEGPASIPTAPASETTSVDPSPTTTVPNIIGPNTTGPNTTVPTTSGPTSVIPPPAAAPGQDGNSAEIVALVLVASGVILLGSAFAIGRKASKRTAG